MTAVSLCRFIVKEILIDCCGCGNWELIENLIDDVSSLKWNCLDENNNLTFGKYKGKNAEEVERLDKDYYNWALGYVGGFQEQLFCRKHHISPEELAKIKKKIKSKLSFTSDDWIKSTINNNFDFVLDQYDLSWNGSILRLRLYFFLFLICKY